MKLSNLLYNRKQPGSRRVVLSALAPLFLLALSLVSLQIALASNGNILQCANGPDSAPNTCTASGDWQGGDLNRNNSHYREGDVVPFRMEMNGLTVGNFYSVTLDWSNIQGGKHSYDYITSYNVTMGSANPCAGTAVSCAGAPNTTPIPTDPSVSTCLGLKATQIAGSFALWGGTLSALNSTMYSMQSCPTLSGNQDQQIVVTFQATATDLVLAWGGHVSSQSEWGNGLTAVNISGSPYHMILFACSFSCTGKNLQIQAGAIASTNLTTQRSPNTAGLAIAPGTPVSDTAIITGNLTASPAGTITFYICRSVNASVTPTCSSAANEDTTAGEAGQGFPATVTVNTSGNVGTASSPNFTTKLLGRYCFLAIYNPVALSPYPQNIALIDANNAAQVTAECFTISGPTAVTVNSFEAQPQSLVAGAGEWAALGLGIAGVLTLGLVAFVVMRRK